MKSKEDEYEEVPSLTVFEMIERLFAFVRFYRNKETGHYFFIYPQMLFTSPGYLTLPQALNAAIIYCLDLRREA